VNGAKLQVARDLAEVNGQVRVLYRIGWRLASAALLAFDGFVLAKLGLTQLRSKCPYAAGLAGGLAWAGATCVVSGLHRGGAH
jgi:hypothetical protein